MIKSMTGFGRALADDGKRSVIVELKGVNHRYFDVNIRMPKSLFPLEDRMRKTLQEYITRGKLDMFITYRNHIKDDLEVKYNESLAGRYASVLKKMRDEFGLVDDVSVSLISKFPDVVYTEETEENLDEIWILLERAVRDSATIMQDMRQKEGELLKRDMLQKADSILEKLEVIKVREISVMPAYREKLFERLKGIMDQIPVDENRVALEVALYTDRASIDEEITRLSSHMEQFRSFLSEEEPVGRKLDFLAQEMNREANTMASKSVDITITNTVLEIKNDIEKIREQMQNIE
ncbi:MAG: YicC family protein [Youngiibacter sp.]|nr:YicC family protein [Youngiibacter sp.]